MRQRVGTTVTSTYVNSVSSSIQTDVNSSTQLVSKLQRVKNLHELWKEWEFGLSGYKATKDFTLAERRAERSKYSRRNVFWQIISNMVRKGYSAQLATDLVYDHYGGTTTITVILERHIRDKSKDDLQAVFR